mmetsp:Transcript_53942/g.107375  ORF Transcript_53942/g.107375 Transcript_53942/m.107375 type:complete len:200 (-) Transcript_53942:484-1083(-)
MRSLTESPAAFPLSMAAAKHATPGSSDACRSCANAAALPSSSCKNASATASSCGIRPTVLAASMATRRRSGSQQLIASDNPERAASSCASSSSSSAKKAAAELSSSSGIPTVLALPMAARSSEPSRLFIARCRDSLAAARRSLSRSSSFASPRVCSSNPASSPAAIAALSDNTSRLAHAMSKRFRAPSCSFCCKAPSAS